MTDDARDQLPAPPDATPEASPDGPPKARDREAPPDRRIPQDPAGTQPKVDPASLIGAREALAPPSPGANPSAGPDGDAPEASRAEPVPAKPREAPHAARFAFVLGALVAVGAIAVVALVAILGRGGGAEEEPWSAWRPTADGVEGAQQIADHVQRRYRLKTGEQMVLVTASDLEIADYELDMVFRRRAEDGGTISRITGDTILYRLCGLGRDCAIPGRPTASRGLLLRREALELALYSFRYLRGLDHVVLFLPPAYAEVPAGEGSKKTRRVPVRNQMLLYSRSDLEPALDAPLSRTLAPTPPSQDTIARAPETALVERLAERGQYSFSLTQGAADDRVLLVLEKLTVQEALERQQEEAEEALAAGTASSGDADD